MIGIGIIMLITFIFILLIFDGINSKYISTNGNVKPDEDFKQILSYVVHDRLYKKYIEPNEKKFTYPNGSCTVYYLKSNPDIYSVNDNPDSIFFYKKNIFINKA